MKIVVVGGHGFVGTHVANLLRGAGHEVITLSRRDGLDLTDLESAQSLFRKHQPYALVNCAAFVGSLNFVAAQAARIVDLNMRMLLNIYRAASEHSSEAIIINPIANCAFPATLKIYRESEFWDGPLHDSVLSYGSTRRMLVVLGECYRQQFGVKSLNFFVPNMYGPFDSTDPDKAHALNALAGKIVKSQRSSADSITVWGSGVAVREWLYAGDFARIVQQIVELGHMPEFQNPVSIAQNWGLSVREIVELLVKATGFAGEVRWDRSQPEGTERKVMDDAGFRGAFS